MYSSRHLKTYMEALMRKQNLLNQIIECLEIESENYAYADVNPAILQKFMQLKKTESARSAKPAAAQASESVRPAPVPFSAPTANSAKTKEVASAISPENTLKPVKRPELDKMTMDELVATVAECALCELHKTRLNTVFGGRKPQDGTNVHR